MINEETNFTFKLIKSEILGYNDLNQIMLMKLMILS